MGKRDLRTVIAPSWQARSSDLWISENKLIRRPLEFFALQKIVVTICYILISSVGMATMAKAECVPYPDCATIGYTETSCETQAVKCPFDGSKLYCLPCDSKYQYTCNGVGEVGEGAGCKGKYEACGCKSGYNYFCGINFCKLNYC